MLENKFKTLCQNFSKDKKYIQKLWLEIESQHLAPSRHYHTLRHLEQIYKEFEGLMLTALLEFSIFYHDIIYDTKRNDNEEQSALLAQRRLKSLNVPKELNEKIFQLIIETKSHKASCRENELFLDADLSILGSSPKEYQQYSQKVRKEYAIYDEVTYAKGRAKALKIFLEKEKIYESQYFYDKYEKQARDNILIEYNSLIKNLLKKSTIDTKEVHV